MTIQISKQEFKRHRTDSISLKSGILLNCAVIFYVVSGYFVSWLTFFSPSVSINLLGYGLLTHSLITSAYMVHEFIHGSVFQTMKWNIVGGNIMLWLNGSCYSGFRNLAKIHITHHINSVDSADFDLPRFLRNSSKPVRYIILGLEWLYFPAANLFLRFREILILVQKQNLSKNKLRIFFFLIVRAVFFLFIGILSTKALALYFLSYISMINILRFMDAFQHTYEVYPSSSKLPRRDTKYEQENTFSILFPKHLSWFNLLFLNFGYHNAHHADMKCPWYQLNSLNEHLFPVLETNTIPISNAVKSYHHFRIERLLLGQGDVLKKEKSLDIGHFYGATGVSFLLKA
ncbi:MAG: fatty acid desaturase [Cyanobacteria bacterium P01_A01_bin.15]